MSKRSSEATVAEKLLGLTLNDDTFVALLRSLIGEVEQLQNNPPQGLVPKEDLAIRHIVELLAPYSQEKGGPLRIEHVTFLEGRGNLIITLPGSSDNTVSLMGSHLDTVPATPASWDRPPFELTVEGDKLHGRGTTDSLGHVALITCLLLELAKQQIQLDVTVVAVFIASEEASSTPVGAGVEGLLEAGHLAKLKNGPIVWVDSADSQPCIGTAGAIQWHLHSIGKLFHSGLPHKGINSLELGMEACAKMQAFFYEKFPAHPMEKEYCYSTPSTMKPTQMECAKGGLNQLPPHCTISGDIRLTPFYSVSEVKQTLADFVQSLNVTELPTRGPASKYELPDENLKGTLQLRFGDHEMAGIACDLQSKGFTALSAATKEVLGKVEPYSICGSLPLVREMQEAGFDLIIVGYGHSSVYHADNEYCKLSDMQNAFKILSRTISKVNDGSNKKSRS